MIKGNESNVADIVSEILEKKEFKFLLFYIVHQNVEFSSSVKIPIENLNIFFDRLTI